MAYEDITINQFIKAWFKGDRTVMDEPTFQTVYTEYIDTAALYETDEFNQVTYIHYLNNRVNSIKIAIRLQKEFINNFDIPFINDLAFFKKFGHIVYWNNDKERFLETLDKVENKEKRYISELEKAIKNLKDTRLKKNKGERTVAETRAGFIKTLISLGKIGYKIDRDSTTVEELALMIKQQTEENESIKK